MEGKGDNSTGNTPAKGLNSASAKGDTAPAPVSSQPLTNSLPANVPLPPPVNSPPQASSLGQAPKMPPVNLLPQASNLAQAPNMRPVNSPPQASNLSQAPKMPPVNSPPQASNLAQAPNMRPVNSLPQASNLAQAPNMRPVNSLPQASNLAQAPRMPPINSPPQASNLAQAPEMPPVNSLPQASNLAQAPEMPPVNSLPPASNLAQAPKMPPVNSLPRASNLAQAPKMPPVNSPPQASNLGQAPKMPLVNSPPQASNLVQGPKMPPVNSPPQVSNLAQAPNVPPVNSPLQAASMPPVNLPLQASNVAQTPNVPALNSPPPPNTPPALDSYCPAGHFNKFTSSPNYMPQSSYNPMGPALNPPPAPNVPRQQSTTNTIIVQLGGPTSAPVSDFNLTNYLRNPTKYISADDYSDAYEGATERVSEALQENSFFHTITCEKLKGLDYPTEVSVNIIRLIYFIFQFIYPIIQAIVEEGPVTFNVICTLFAAVGLAFDIFQIGKKIRSKNGSKSNGDNDEAVEDANGEPQSEGVANPQELVIDQIAQDDTAAATAFEAAGVPVEKSKKNKDSTDKKTTTPKKLLHEFVLEMLGEIIIYPSLICNLYGFINDEGWKFENAFDVFNLLLTSISFAMDAVWAKLNHIWALHQLVKKTLEIQKQNNIYSYVTPFNLFVPYSIGLAIAHTLMVMLIGIRIYADNFNTRDHKDEKEMGNYSVTPYTRYMIFCGAYLPLMSGACYIILNKHWFLQVSWILHNEEDAHKKMHYNYITSMPTRVKLFGFLRDKYAYISVATFAPLFIAFYNGGFLQDYDPNDLPDGAASAAGIIGTLFVIVFSIINIQAGIIFTIIIILLMITFCFICTGGGSSSSARNKIIR